LEPEKEMMFDTQYLALKWFEYEQAWLPNAAPEQRERERRAFYSGARALAAHLSHRCDAALVDLEAKVVAMAREEECGEVVQ
jgi:hypothetical protein